MQASPSPSPSSLPFLSSSSITQHVINQNGVKLSNSLKKRKRTKPGKSWIWGHMQKNVLLKETRCLVFININNEIKQCQKKFAIGTSTSSLAAHLRKDHRLTETGELLPLSGGAVQLKTTKLIQKDPNQPTLMEFVDKRPPLSLKKSDRITSRILAWLIDDMQPFNVLTSDTFQEIFLEIDSRYKFPCQDIFKQKLHQSVNFSESKLTSLLRKTLDTFSFTTDLWTEAHKPYIGITTHWLAEDFVMYKAMLTIESFPYPHNAEHIEDCLRREFSKWGIMDKCLAGVTDNASSMVKAMNDFGTTHIRCTAHTIQLSIIDGLKSKEVVDLIGYAKALNSFLSKRNKYQERCYLSQAKMVNSSIQQKNTTILDVIGSDVSTWWNSTFLLLERLIQLYPAVIMLQQDMIKDQDREI